MNYDVIYMFATNNKLDYDELCELIRVATAPQQAEGWVMVPVEPTPAMLVAMWDHREAMRGQSENHIARAGYAAMIAATPSAPTGRIEGEKP